MAFLRVRDVTCTVCQAAFRLVTGDLYVDDVMLCDDCVAALWPRGDASAGDQLAERLAPLRSGEDVPPVGSAERAALEQDVLGRMRSLTDRWASAQELIENRDLLRRALGG